MSGLCILGLVIMVAGFAGVLVCAKIQKTNPTIQPVAMLCAVVMLVGLGLYFWFYLNPPNPAIEHNRIYGLACAHKIGNEIKNAGIQNVVLITSGSGEEFEARKALLEANAGVQVRVIPAYNPNDGTMMDAAAFKNAIKNLDKNTIVIIDTDAMAFSEELGNMFKAKDGVKFVFTEVSGGMVGMLSNFDKAFKNGRILFVVAHQSGDEEFSPDEDELDEAFNNRYLIINKDNFEGNKDKLGIVE